MTTSTLRRLALAAAIALTIVPAWLTGSAQKHKAITLGSGKGLPFSDGIIAGKTLYVAGQEGLDDAGKLMPGGISAETKPRSTTSTKCSRRQATIWPTLFRSRCIWPTSTTFLR